MSKRRRQSGPEWLRSVQQRFPGEHLAFRGREVVGSGDTDYRLREEMDAKYPGETIVIVRPRIGGAGSGTWPGQFVDMGGGRKRWMCR